MKTIINITYPAFALFALAYFALAPQARGICNDACVPGSSSTVLGEDALLKNFGLFNTAIGDNALSNNTFGTSNTATGFAVLNSNTVGNGNTAIGSAALLSNLWGIDNTADGASALSGNTTGSGNIAVGFGAGTNLTTGDNNIDIGNSGVAGEANTIRIGAAGTQISAFIAGVRGTPIAGGIPVGVSSIGQLGVRASSARFKEAIKPMDKASEVILALRPVTFRYKHELDPDGIAQFGLVAEDVAKVNRDLVACDEQGKPYSVRYEAVNAMLLNEFLKEHKAFLEQQHKVQQLEANAADQQKQIEALTAGLQKVSAQLELDKRGSQTVSNNH